MSKPTCLTTIDAQTIAALALILVALPALIVAGWMWRAMPRQDDR